ncbi:hypothetical protein GCM10029964_012640 [Kibdelosporangium lantanae]
MRVAVADSALVLAAGSAARRAEVIASFWVMGAGCAANGRGPAGTGRLGSGQYGLCASRHAASCLFAAGPDGVDGPPENAPVALATATPPIASRAAPTAAASQIRLDLNVDLNVGFISASTIPNRSPPSIR